jgi:spermidine/putrescine transport system permease protein
MSKPRPPRPPFKIEHMPAFGALTAAMLAFLYVPLMILVAYAFNGSRIVTVWGGFSLNWFVVALNDANIHQAAYNSVVIAVAATVLSTMLGLAAALALERGELFRGRLALSTLFGLPLVVPEIVTAVTTLVFFTAIGLQTGLLAMIIAHTVFCVPFAMLPIQARLRNMGRIYEDAASDLYADEWRAFRRVTLPLLAPGIASGAMLAFVSSIDDFLISMMLSGAGSTTLPVYIYSMTRLGVTPEINAVSALLLALSIGLVVLSFTLQREPSRR